MKRNLAFFLALLFTLSLAGCAGGGQHTAPDSSPANPSASANPPNATNQSGAANQASSASQFGSAGETQLETAPEKDTPENTITLSRSILQLEPGLSAVRFDGDYGFDGFLEQGGASSDGEVVQFLAQNFLGDIGLDFLGNLFGCSTIAAVGPDGDILFGRNFDWNRCDAMIVEAHPEDGYTSLATVNMNFITRGVGGMMNAALQLDQVKTLAALYAPLDGMNEAGLAVSVNMIQDSATINQNTGKPGLTTTTAIRLLLDQAATVEEALELLGQYDLHASMGYMVHFAIADKTGRSVAVEYINNEMVVLETPILTNFYLTQGEKYGIGTEQSHQRFEILENLLAENATLTENDVRDALSSVSKGNFGEFESTEWSIVMNLTDGTARYFHRENYRDSYFFALKGGAAE